VVTCLNYQIELLFLALSSATTGVGWESELAQALNFWSASLIV